MKLLILSQASSLRSYQLVPHVVRVEALDLITDTVTILLLFGPTEKRGAQRVVRPSVVSLPTVPFNIAILITCTAISIIITPSFREVPLKVSYLITVEATLKACYRSALLCHQ